MAAGVLFLLASVLTSWLWYQAQVGLAQIDGELRAEVEAEVWNPGNITATLQHTSLQNRGVGKQSLEVVQTQIVDLGSDWAIVELLLQQGTRSYRQTRVYRQTERGWQYSPPTEQLWGEPHTLETEFFVFHYFALDSRAVNTTATELDTLYPRMVAAYQRLQPSANKWEIWVSPQQSSTEQSSTDVVRGISDDAQFVITSPAVQLLPVEISKSDWLAQDILLRLLNDLVEETIQTTVPERLRRTQAEQQLQGLLASVQLWQAWDTDLPLASLRKPVVQWVYRSTPNGERQLPTYEAQLCDLHRLWTPAPAPIPIPLFCGAAESPDPYQTWQYLYTYAWRLTDRSIFTPRTPFLPAPSSDLSAVVGLATVVEYAATAYGPESISRLVANTPFHSEWETLIPASFGVELVEFERGWQTYLREEYGFTRLSP